MKAMSGDGEFKDVVKNNKYVLAIFADANTELEVSIGTPPQWKVPGHSPKC